MNQAGFSPFSPTERARGHAPGSFPETPDSNGFIALLEAFRATGGTAPGEIVGRLLEEHQAGDTVSLARLIHSGQVFGFEWRASLWIPMFQFDADDLSLKPDAQSVRAELPSLWSGWTTASWFAAPNSLLGDLCPADMLLADPQAALQAARSLASAAGLALHRLPRVHPVAAHA
jgi:hypothetical protein